MITVATGLPRSGTSMLMQILESGGMEIFTDSIRKADINNSKGYYEYEKVKKLQQDNSWLDQAEGKAIKVIVPLLKYLPMNFRYQMVFIERNLDEVLRSQTEMLTRLNKPDNADESQLRNAFQSQITFAKKSLHNQHNVDVLYVNYNEIIKNPAKHLKTIHEFIEPSLDYEKMVQCVDSKMYRQRKNV